MSTRLEPGDLQIFKGRYSLHRVRPLAGSRARRIAILSYVGEPGMVGSPERTFQLYGRVAKAPRTCRPATKLWWIAHITATGEPLTSITYRRSTLSAASAP
jgi:hypothetical protein